MKRSPSIWGINARPGVVIRESWLNNFKRQDFLPSANVLRRTRRISFPYVKLVNSFPASDGKTTWRKSRKIAFRLNLARIFHGPSAASTAGAAPWGHKPCAVSAGHPPGQSPFVLQGAEPVPGAPVHGKHGRKVAVALPAKGAEEPTDRFLPFRSAGRSPARRVACATPVGRMPRWERSGLEFVEFVLGEKNRAVSGRAPRNFSPVEIE
jgi:hypothetical protein